MFEAKLNSKTVHLFHFFKNSNQVFEIQDEIKSIRSLREWLKNDNNNIEKTNNSVFESALKPQVEGVIGRKSI